MDKKKNKLPAPSKPATGFQALAKGDVKNGDKRNSNNLKKNDGGLVILEGPVVAVTRTTEPSSDLHSQSRSRRSDGCGGGGSIGLGGNDEKGGSRGDRDSRDTHGSDKGGSWGNSGEGVGGYGGGGSGGGHGGSGGVGSGGGGSGSGGGGCGGGGCGGGSGGGGGGCGGGGCGGAG